MIKERKPRMFYGYVVVAAGFLIIAVMWGTNYTFGIFFEPLLAEFGWTRAMTAGAFSLSFILYGLLGVVAGRLTDRFGPRIVVTVCALFLGSGYVLVSQVNAIWQLYLFYGVMVGVGLSGSFVPIASTVARWFVRRRGLMTGIAISGVGVGMLILSLGANWLISNYGWRSSYITVGITAAVMLAVFAQFLRRDPSQVGQLPYGKNEPEEKDNLRGTDISLGGAAQGRQFWMLSVAFLCFGLAIGAVLAHIVLHAIGLGVSTTSAGAILAVTGGLSTVGRIVMGSAGDRIGHKNALIICFGLMSAALFWLLFAKKLWMLYLFAVIFGFGYGGIAPLQSPLIAELFGLSSHGVILGVTEFGVALGETIGPVVAGHIFDITRSYHLAFLASGVIGLLGAVLMSRLKTVKRTAL